jgi:hypothetical protein
MAVQVAQWRRGRALKRQPIALNYTRSVYCACNDEMIAASTKSRAIYKNKAHDDTSVLCTPGRVRISPPGVLYAPAYQPVVTYTFA